MIPLAEQAYKAYLEYLASQDIEGVPWTELDLPERSAWEAAIDYILEVTE